MADRLMTERRLAICLYTHMRHPDRLEYAKVAAATVIKKCLWEGDGSGHFHVADDNSRREFLDELLKEIREHGYDPTISHGMGRGYGASHNAATQKLHQDFDAILAIEDDWELIRPLPIDRLLSYFDNPDVRSIRLGYLGWTQRLQGHLIKAGDQSDTCLLIDANSTEPHVNAGHPRLETVEYQREVGEWPETVDAGSTEFAWCMREQARRGVVWPMDLGGSASQGYAGQFFAHIGAIQAREDQQE